MPGVSDQRLGREERRKKTVFSYRRKVLPHGATVVVIFPDQARSLPFHGGVPCGL